MSARVCSPPMTDLSSLPSSANIPTGHHHAYYPAMSTSSSCSSSSEVLLPKRRNVSRNLFGSPDPRSAEYARNKVKEIQKTDKQKWNFDFDRGVPLTGRFQWVPVAVEESPVVTVVPPVSVSIETSVKSVSASTSTTIIASSSSSSSSSSSTKQTTRLITDFMKVRKRKAPSQTATTVEKKAK